MKNNKMLQDNIKAINAASKKTISFLNGIIDEGSLVETDVFAAGKSFLDGKEALGEGVVTGYATIADIPVHIFAQNAEVMKGSFGEAHANKIKKVINKAVKTGTPLVSFIDCSGARIGEGVRMLEAMGEVISALCMAKENILHICVVKGNAVGMVASMVNLADFVFMSDKSVLSLAAPQAVAAKYSEFPKLSDILGAKAYSQAGSVCDFTYKSNDELVDKIKTILTLTTGDIAECEDDANRETPTLDKSYTVQTALKAIADNEKYLEANSEYAKEVVTAYTCINSIAVGVLALDGYANDGYISIEGIDKAINFLEKATGNGMPIVTLVDSKGIKACECCEMAGISKKLAKLMELIATSTTPMISVITGKAIGLAYTVFASKGIGFDYTLAGVDAEISPMTSEAAVNVVYNEELKKGEDRDKLAERYSELEANPFISAKDGYVDNIIELSTMRPYIASALMMLLGI